MFSLPKISPQNTLSTRFFPPLDTNTSTRLRPLPTYFCWKDFRRGGAEWGCTTSFQIPRNQQEKYVGNVSCPCVVSCIFFHRRCSTPLYVCRLLSSHRSVLQELVWRRISLFGGGSGSRFWRANISTRSSPPTFSTSESCLRFEAGVHLKDHIAKNLSKKQIITVLGENVHTPFYLGDVLETFRYSSTTPHATNKSPLAFAPPPPNLTHSQFHPKPPHIHQQVPTQAQPN